MKHLLLVITCLVWLSGYSQGDGYDYITTTAENVNLYINPNTIKVESQYEKQNKFWVFGYIDSKDLLTTQSKLSIKYNNLKLKKTTLIKMLCYVDCDDDKFSTCRTIYYDKNGAVLIDSNNCEYMVDYDDVIPETIGETIFNYICK